MNLGIDRNTTTIFKNTNDSTAYFTYAHLFYRGKYVNKDYKEAFKRFKIASELGNAKSFYYLGWIMQYGEGTEKNLTNAKKNYQIAALKGIGGAKQQLEE